MFLLVTWGFCIACILGGRGRPRKRAASLQQKEFPVEIHEEEATLGSNVDEHAKEAKSKCSDGSESLDFLFFHSFDFNRPCMFILLEEFVRVLSILNF